MLGDVNRKVNVAMGVVNTLQAKTLNLNFGLYLLTFWQTFSKKSILYCLFSSSQLLLLYFFNKEQNFKFWSLQSVFYRFLSRFMDFYLPWTSDDDILSRGVNHIESIHVFYVFVFTINRVMTLTNVDCGNWEAKEFKVPHFQISRPKLQQLPVAFRRKYVYLSL